MRNGYLIGAVDHAAPSDQNWKTALEKEIVRTNLDLPQVTLFDPAGPWKLCEEFVHGPWRRSFIEQVNMKAMELSHFAIANLPQSIFSVGSIVEIDAFWRDSKPIIIATDIAYGKNVYLTNRTSRDLYIEYPVGSKPEVWVTFAIEKLFALYDQTKSSYPSDEDMDYSINYELRPGKSIEKAYPCDTPKMCAAGGPSSQTKIRY